MQATAVVLRGWVTQLGTTLGLLAAVAQLFVLLVAQTI
jgi:hypothetical protein